MGDALLRIADVEQPQRMAARRRPRRIDEGAAAETGMSCKRWNRMILHHHGEIGTADRERAPFDVLQDLRRPHVIDHDPVDVDERLAARILGQPVPGPDLIEQRRAHRRPFPPACQPIRKSYTLEPAGPPSLTYG